jgi:hypothetical protein
VARWRTSAAAAAVVLVATACGHTEAPQPAAATTATVPGRAQLAPAGQKPLKVQGSGFHPNEKVVVTAKAKGGRSVSTVADSTGTFVVSIPGVDGCDSVTVTATGSKGSHAEFNLSQVVCLDE